MLTRRRRSRMLDSGVLELFERAGANAVDAVRLLRDLVGDYPERAELARDLVDLEHAGDRLAHDIFHRLNGGRIGRPLAGSAEVHRLASALDDIVDHAEETADTLGLYAIEAPMEQAVAQAEVLVAATEQVAAALGALRAGRVLTEHLREIHRLENEGDRLVRDGVAALFAAGVDPMVVIRWKDVFELLERAIDACETVAHLLEGIVLELG